MLKHTKTMIAAFALMMTAGVASASTPVMLGNAVSQNVAATASAVPGDDWFVSFGAGDSYHGDHIGIGFGWGFGHHDHCHSRTRVVRYRRPAVRRAYVVKKRRPLRKIRRGRGRRIIIR